MCYSLQKNSGLAVGTGAVSRKAGVMPARVLSTRRSFWAAFVTFHHAMMFLHLHWEPHRNGNDDHNDDLCTMQITMAPLSTRDDTPGWR